MERPSWAVLGPILGARGPILGPFWASFGPSKAISKVPKPSRSDKTEDAENSNFAPVFYYFCSFESVVGGAPWPLGDVLGRSWRLLKACQVPSRVTETYLERSETTS